LNHGIGERDNNRARIGIEEFPVVYYLFPRLHQLIGLNIETVGPLGPSPRIPSAVEGSLCTKHPPPHKGDKLLMFAAAG
jgi:hypothetical protein